MFLLNFSLLFIPIELMLIADYKHVIIIKLTVLKIARLVEQGCGCDQESRWRVIDLLDWWHLRNKPAPYVRYNNSLHHTRNTDLYRPGT